MGSIVLNNLGKVYGEDTVAVHNVNLEIKDGEFVVFVGPSGCGKSTILRMIAGLEHISFGEVIINDEVMNNVPARDRDIAMVFQNYALYPQMTARQNIGFALEMRKLPREEIEKRVLETASTLNISELLDRKPKELSGGQRQRVAMGRAIIRNAEAYLLDEPLSNLDAKLRSQLREELSKLHARLGVTMIHVTHDQIEAMTLGQRVAVFSVGHLFQYDTPETLYKSPNSIFVAGFIGSPTMNFFEAVSTRKASELSISVGKRKIGIQNYQERFNINQDGKLLVGIRPEHINWGNHSLELEDGFLANVEFIENLEPESYVTAIFDDKEIKTLSSDDLEKFSKGTSETFSGTKDPVITFRVSSENLPQKNSSILISLPPEKLYLFNANTGQSYGKEIKW